MMIIEPTQYSLHEDLERIVRENQKKSSRKYLAARLAEIITQQARRTDMVMTKNWDGRFIILCPENNSDGTSILAQRIQTDVKANLGVSIQYGIATFPGDALTLDELLRRAETNMTAVRHVGHISGQAIYLPQPAAHIDEKNEKVNPVDSTIDHEFSLINEPPNKSLHKE
jgi:GGDEF domain-containing protein